MDLFVSAHLPEFENEPKEEDEQMRNYYLQSNTCMSNVGCSGAGSLKIGGTHGGTIFRVGSL